MTCTGWHDAIDFAAGYSGDLRGAFCDRLCDRRALDRPADTRELDVFISRRVISDSVT